MKKDASARKDRFPSAPIEKKKPQKRPVKSVRPDVKNQRIVLSQKGNKYYVQPEKGKVLLDAALKQSQAVDYKCRKGTCGKCAVTVESGKDLFMPPSEREQSKLKEQMNKGVRLACQAVTR
ncbi:2Fe-2S iron-sulfur cluster-binding protein [Bacillus sp. FJAT-44742]|uniref:2Fe-2S iron-sulfur cluster-binding protein n=1 Tax=Bacillus sp. FJAT-44742 TaxID=2014005 RepID=UPI0012FEB73B|nr:2Fe-2S iron-sulfur cluster-binding protein [Bacillus sp. FJAT-44742]